MQLSTWINVYFEFIWYLDIYNKDPFNCIFTTIEHSKERAPGAWFNIKTWSYYYRKSHCGDEMVVRPSYVHNQISYTGKMASLYWTTPRVAVPAHLSLSDMFALFVKYNFYKHSSTTHFSSLQWHKCVQHMRTLYCRVMIIMSYVLFNNRLLTHWGRDKMDAI